MTKFINESATSADELKRSQFIKHLTYILENINVTDSGAVVGLNGKWGSGKTTVLKIMEASTDKIKDAPLLVHYNPWMISGTPALVEQLFKEIASSLVINIEKKEKSLKLANAITEFATTLSHIKKIAPAADFIAPGLSVVVSKMGDGFDEASKTGKALIAQAKKTAEKMTLSGQKNTLISHIKNLKKRIVVCIDDLDRLPPKEIVEIIQAIKSVADFPNIVYLVSYDKSIVAKALSTVLGIENGFNYLEKIIQFEVNIPIPSSIEFHEMLESRLLVNEKLNACDPIGKNELMAALDEIKFFIKTPRDINRLSISMMSSEVQFDCSIIPYATLLKIEAASLKIPNFIDWIIELKNIHQKNNSKNIDDLIEEHYAKTGLNNAAELCQSQYFRQLLNLDKQNHGFNNGIIWNYWLSQTTNEDIKIRNLFIGDEKNLLSSEYSGTIEDFKKFCISIKSWGANELKKTQQAKMSKFFALYVKVMESDVQNLQSDDQALFLIRNAFLVVMKADTQQDNDFYVKIMNYLDVDNLPFTLDDIVNNDANIKNKEVILNNFAEKIIDKLSMRDIAVKYEKIWSYISYLLKIDKTDLCLESVNFFKALKNISQSSPENFAKLVADLKKGSINDDENLSKFKDKITSEIDIQEFFKNNPGIQSIDFLK